MMSTIKDEYITVDTLAKVLPNILDHLLAMGIAGQDVVNQTCTKPPLPIKWEVDELGQKVIVDGRLVSKFDLDTFKTGLSPSGVSDYAFARKLAQEKRAQYEAQELVILGLLVAKLSPASRSLLKMITGENGYLAVMNRGDAVALWGLILSTHRRSFSNRDKTKSLTHLAALKQGNLTHAEFMLEFTDASDIFCRNFADDKGMISSDALLRVLYLSALNGSYFAGQTSDVLDRSMGGSNLADLQAFMQQHVLSVGGEPAASPASTPSGSSLSGSVAGLVGSFRSLGILPEGSKACKACWKMGFDSTINQQEPHEEGRPATCPYVTKRKENAARKGKLGLGATTLTAADVSKIVSAHFAEHSVSKNSDLYSAFVAVLGVNYWDNGASMNVTNCESDFVPDSLVKLSSPIPMGGVGGGVALTHVGDSTCVPSFCPQTYLSKGATVKLTSLSQLMKSGGSYASRGTSELVVKDPSGCIIDVSTMAPSGLFPVSSPLLCGSCDSLAFPAPVVVRHMSAEARERCDKVEKLHWTGGVHCSDHVLKQTLAFGGFPWTGLTPADVDINRQWRGPCPGCAIGKIKNKAMQPSKSPPPTAMGDKVHIDIERRLAKSPGGKWFGIRFFDEFSGDCDTAGAVDGRARSIFDAIVAFVTRNYYRSGHSCKQLVADWDPVLEPVVDMLAALPRPITLSLVDPGQHEQSSECIHGHQKGRVNAVRAGLPYNLPPTYDPFLYRYVNQRSNDLVNSHSFPSTPYILKYGKRRTPHFRHPDLPFGAVCVVQQSVSQRRIVAKKSGQLVSSIPPGEIGDCMGFSQDTPGDYDFLLSSGLILPRRQIVVLQGVIPFGWVPKTVVQANLPAPLVFPERTGTAPVGDDESAIDGDTVPVSLDPVVEVLSDVVGVTDDPVVDSVTDVTVDPVTDVTTGDPVVGVFDDPVAVDVRPVVDEDDVVRGEALVDTVVPVASEATVGTHDADTVDPVASRVVLDLPDPPVTVRPVRSRSNHDYKVLAGGRRALCSCVPASGGFPAFLCDDCDDQSWEVVSRSRRVRGDLQGAGLSVVSSSDHDERVAVETAVDSCAYVLHEGEFPLLHAVSYFAALCPVAYAAMASSADLRPVASDVNQEVPLHVALRSVDYDEMVGATVSEITRQQSIGSLGLDVYKSRSVLPDGSACVPAMSIYKRKVASGPLKCRLAARGDDKQYLRLTEGIETFSPTCSDDDNIFVLAAMQAYAESRGEKIGIKMFDIGGAFCRVKRTSSLRLFLELPPNLPHPLAGCCLEVFAALYGLKESNRMFSIDVQKCLVQNGFVPCVASPSTFHVSDDVDPAKKAFITTHVDDFRSVDSNAPQLAEKLRLCLEARYSEVTDCSSKPYCGVEHTVLPNGAVVLTQDRYIDLVAGRIGVRHMPPVLNPGCKDFFMSSTLDADLVPVEPAVYMALTGALVQMTKTRFEVKHLVSHLSSKNICPNEGDYKKAINVLRALHSTPGVGPVYKSSTTQRFIYADAAFADHENGASSGAYFECFGEFGAPFSSYAKAQSDVAPNPMTAEYYSACHAVQDVYHFNQFAAELGVAQVGPVTLVLDCNTAINLIQAPEVTKKSRHMNSKHHYIRQANERGVVSIKHVMSPDMRCDNITKVFANSIFKSARDNMLHRKAILEP